MMSFSFTRIILDETEIAVYKRGLKIADEKKVNLQNIQNNACQAEVKGTSIYNIKLGFKRTGSPRYECDCPYFTLNKAPCKHIIATALYWDRSRDVPDPDGETLTVLTIPEPDFTAKDINYAYKNPLTVNLDILRADPTGWMRPHARLPEKPSICKTQNCSVIATKQGISELNSWTRKYKYDMYFCAGEMMAGFCELIRWVKLNMSDLTSDDCIKVFELLEKAHHKVLDNIDDSDGLHIFSEAHLYNLFDSILINFINIQKEKIAQIRSGIDQY